MKYYTHLILTAIFWSALTGSTKASAPVLIDLTPYFNSSVFDDGIGDNQEGGWTDEGLNDFYTYPPLDFTAQRYRGYRFHLVDPARNEGRNLVLIGHQDTNPNTPDKVQIDAGSAKGRYVFLMHSEGRVREQEGDLALGGTLRLLYTDGTGAELPLRLNRELANWYQGKWWNNCEVARDDAPAALKESNCDPDRYKELGGTNFSADVLAHADAVRWPVTQGVNAISRSWNIPVVFWALRWEHPHPEKEIAQLEISSTGACLIGLAAITISDEDYSLLRQTEVGKMGPVPTPPVDYFANREEKLASALLPELARQDWSRGLRRLELRSDKMLTIVVDHMANTSQLKNPEGFVITSADDDDYARGVIPLAVHRFSRGARYRALSGDRFKVYPDHWLHLELPTPLKDGHTYTVTLQKSLIPETHPPMKVQQIFKPEDLPNPSFKVNQVGYSGNVKTKYAYLSSYLGDGEPLDLSSCTTFDVIDEATGQTILSGPVTKVSDADPQGGDTLYRMDLGALQQDGRFYLAIKGLGRSYPFLNGAPAAQELYRICHRGLLFQRSGQAVEGPLAEGWNRPAAHTNIYVTQTNKSHPTVETDPTQPGPYHVPQGPLPFRGGHYDAGDYDLRPMHIAVPELLLTLYEALPEKFYDGQVNIPEQNNGIPDLIDEAAWNLLSLEYIQDYAGSVRGLKGGVAPGLETFRHPHEGEGLGRDPLPYYMRKVTGYFSFAAAAEFAHMARIMEAFDSERARTYLDRARAAYDYGMQHLDDAQPKLDNALVEQGEGWKEEHLNGARLWANTELYCSTGEEPYWSELVRLNGLRTGPVAGSVGLGQLFSLFLSKRTHPDPERVQQWKQEFLDRAEAQLKDVTAAYEKGYAAPTPASGGWGNTSCVVINIEQLTRAYMLTRDSRFLEAIAPAIDFTLGMNPSEMSWMTGAGTVYPMDPLNLNCIDDGIEEPHPGILWYGPTSYWWNDKVLLYPDKKNMGFYRRVVDAWGMVSQCEYTVWETQAPFLFAVGALLPDTK